MSRLILVRHGQAHAFAEDSDRLTERGEAQARQFGAWFAAQGVAVDEVRCGGLLRHRQTVGQIASVCAGLPAAVIDERWNEFDSTAILARLAPLLAAREPRFAEMWAASEAHRKTAEVNRYFQRMFEVLMTQWVRGELTAEGVESWAEFRTRVREGLREIVEGAVERRTVLVVASGGSIATAVAGVLRAPDATALELNWRMRNTAVTEMLYSKGRVSLDLFNATPHLATAEITYR